jgi:hypothetical protein
VLEEDYPTIASYLRSLTGEPEPDSNDADTSDALGQLQSSEDADVRASVLTDRLMGRVGEIMERTRGGGSDGTDNAEADAELHEAVTDAVAEAMAIRRRGGDTAAVMETSETGAPADDPSRREASEGPDR